MAGESGFDPIEMREAILDRLSTIIDPDTGADVLKMQLVRELNVDQEGLVRYVFQPSSPLCPLAVPLALAIHNAVAEVKGVLGQRMEVVGYVQAAKLNAILQEIEG
jgi:metal-sulfur cluster biosynthetic enzyme